MGTVRWVLVFGWLLAGCGGSSVDGGAAKVVTPASHPAPRDAPTPPAPVLSDTTVVPAPDAGSGEPPQTAVQIGADGGRPLDDRPASVSVGAPDHGSLRHGVALPDRGPGFRFNPRRPKNARYGTRELVAIITRAAARLPEGPPLMVNDLGLPEGGPIRQHGSHQSGRDADILFFYLDGDNRPHPPIGVPVEPDLTGVDYRDLADPDDDVPLRLDVPRTWRFMRALVEEAGNDLQRIFIVEHVRAALLREARQTGAPASVVTRFAEITCQPGTPHDDHMHIRLHCTPADMGAGCLDKPPVYPWRRKDLRALGMKPILSRLRPDPVAVAERTTSPEQARKRAGKMHREVTAFLERRKAWLKRAGPPRRYCR